MKFEDRIIRLLKKYIKKMDEREKKWKLQTISSTKTLKDLRRHKTGRIKGKGKTAPVGKDRNHEMLKLKRESKKNAIKSKALLDEILKISR